MLWWQSARFSVAPAAHVVLLAPASPAAPATHTAPAVPAPPAARPFVTSAAPVVPLNNASPAAHNSNLP